MIPVDEKTGRCGICGRKLTLEELKKYQPSPNMEDRSYKPRCPICGNKCTTIFRKEHYGDIVGCNRCLYPVDAGEDEAALPDDYFNDMTVEKLWKDFTDVPRNPATWRMEQSFRDFPEGTPYMDILRWFDEHHSKGVSYLLYGEQGGQHNGTEM